MTEYSFTHISIKDIEASEAIALFDTVENERELSLIKKLAEDGYLIIISSIDFGKRIEFSLKEYHTCIRVLNWQIFSYSQRMKPHDDAYNTVEQVYDYLLTSRKIFTYPLMRLYGHMDAEIAFKKHLIVNLYEFYSLLRYAHIISEDVSDVMLVLSEDSEETKRWLLRAGISLDSDSIRVIPHVRKRSPNLKERFRMITQVMSKVYTTLRSIRSVSSSVPRDEFVVGLRIFNNDIRFLDKHVRVDWIIDGKVLKRNECILLADEYINESYVNECSSKNYKLAKLYENDNYEVISLEHLWKNLILGLSYSFLVFAAQFSLIPNRLTARIYEEGFIYYIRWTRFLMGCKIKNYIAYHVYQREYIFGNILLKNSGCRTIIYKHSNSSENIYNYSDKSSWRNVIHSYMKHDVELHWGTASIESTKLSYGKSKNYLSIGSIWPQVYGLSNKTEFTKSENFNFLIYNTSFSAGGVNSADDHYAFLDCIVSLMAKIPDENIRFIFKPKIPFELYWKNNDHKEIVELCLKLKDDSRFRIIDNRISASSVLDNADFVICMAFSSPGAESLYYGRKTIFLDPLNRYSSSYFDKYSNLVAHSKTEFLNLVSFWLNKDQDYLERFRVSKFLPDYGGIHDANRLNEIRNKLFIH